MALAMAPRAIVIVFFFFFKSDETRSVCVSWGSAPAAAVNRRGRREWDRLSA
jgi:hypothetical protein